MTDSNKSFWWTLTGLICLLLVFVWLLFLLDGVDQIRRETEMRREEEVEQRAREEWRKHEDAERSNGSSQP